MLTIGDEALLALWMLARPLARPGPRCSRVAAGLSLIRAYPSAAPVTTPSNRPSTQRMPSTRSRAATKCISEVPGLAKQTLTPPPTKVRTRLSAPFIANSPKIVSFRMSMPAGRRARKAGGRSRGHDLSCSGRNAAGSQPSVRRRTVGVLSADSHGSTRSQPRQLIYARPCPIRRHGSDTQAYWRAPSTRQSARPARRISNPHGLRRARRTRLSALCSDRRPAALSSDQPALRAHLHCRHHQPRLWRMAERVWRRQDDDRAARPPDPPLRNHRDRQRELAL